VPDIIVNQAMKTVLLWGLVFGHSVQLLTAAQVQPGQQTVNGQANAQAQPPPSIDAGLGPCALELTVTTKDGKAAGASNVKVHIAYGFGGFHKLDLEAGTNSDGKVKFTGLPSRVRRPPLEFRASKDQLTGIAMYDPASECQAKHDIVLAPEKAEGK
jgi:hypothetical protein